MFCHCYDIFHWLSTENGRLWTWIWWWIVMMEIRNLVPEIIMWTLKLSLGNTAQHCLDGEWCISEKLFGVLGAPEVTIINAFIPPHRNRMNCFEHTSQYQIIDPYNNPYYKCQENSSDSVPSQEVTFDVDLVKSQVFSSLLQHI